MEKNITLAPIYTASVYTERHDQFDSDDSGLESALSEEGDIDMIGAQYIHCGGGRSSS